MVSPFLSNDSETERDFTTVEASVRIFQSVPEVAAKFQRPIHDFPSPSVPPTSLPPAPLLHSSLSSLLNTVASLGTTAKRPRDSRVAMPSVVRSEDSTTVTVTPPTQWLKRRRTTITCNPSFRYRSQRDGLEAPRVIHELKALNTGVPSLPDEVLVSIFRFVPTAEALARLRTVCVQWCQVIDGTSSVWRGASFRGAAFSRRVQLHAPSRQLQLGPVPGTKAVSIAARSGNEWAQFLYNTLFGFQVLHAITVPQPLASLFVDGRIARAERAFPPYSCQQAGMRRTSDIWIAVHAARDGTTVLPLPLVDVAACRVEIGDDWPRGAVVGVIHVTHAVRIPGEYTARDRWMWYIDRAVSLKKPLRCAGFLGVWPVSNVLTDLLIHSLHNQ